MIQFKRQGQLPAFILLSFAALTIQSPLQNVPQSQPEYLISRDDVHNTLSQIFKSDDKIALMSDFDGTLAEINPQPVLTRIDPHSKYALDQLTHHKKILMAFISGRPMSNLQTRVDIDAATYSGKHGMEIIFPNHTEYHYPISQEMYGNCLKLKKLLQDKYCSNGGWIEDKNISLTFHYRDMPVETHAKVITDLTKVISDLGYWPVPAHYAIEIKPPVHWTKGNAALLILNEAYGNNWQSDNVKPIFMGDDNSDEDVMKLLKGRGTTFRVSANPNLKTNADYLVESVQTVTFILEWLANNTD